MSPTCVPTEKRPTRAIELAKFAGKLGKDAVLDLVLPPTCRLCDGPINRQQDFCSTCLRNLSLSELMMNSACRRCGRPRPRIPGSKITSHSGSETDPQDGTLQPCVQCRREKLLFAGVTPLWSYQDRVCEAIVAAKYGHQSPLGWALGRRLGDQIALVTADTMIADLVTFVPSHFTRHLVRGGNGNRAIADGVCSSLRAKNPAIRCRSLLTMRRRIKKQAWLQGEQRRENVKGAFAIKKSYGLSKSLVNRHILLVDDVLTTGATANEVTQVLLASGAEKVTLAVVARAIRSQ